MLNVTFQIVSDAVFTAFADFDMIMIVDKYDLTYTLYYFILSFSSSPGVFVRFFPCIFYQVLYKRGNRYEFILSG